MGVEDMLVGVYCLLHHASIQMTERYIHLAPDHLHDAVGNLGFSARGKTKKGSALPEWLIYLVKWWARLGFNQ